MNLDALYRSRNEDGVEEPAHLSHTALIYIEDQLKKNHPFAVACERLSETSKELASPMARFLDSSLSRKEVGAPFKAPFLWGKVMIADDRDLKLLFRSLRKLASPSHSKASFEVRAFYRLSDIEDFIKTPIKIREGQRSWLNIPSDHYLILVKNFSEIVPYQYHIYAFDAENHQHYMTIFSDENSSADGGLIRLTDLPKD